MKVIKKPNTDWSYKYTCKNCTAELEVEKIDVKYEHHSSYDPRDPRDSGEWDSWTAQCPICRELINIPETALPKAVQVEIKQRYERRPCGSGDPF